LAFHLPGGTEQGKQIPRIAFYLLRLEPSTYVAVLLTGPCRLMMTRNYDFYSFLSFRKNSLVDVPTLVYYLSYVVCHMVFPVATYSFSIVSVKKIQFSFVS